MGILAGILVLLAIPTALIGALLLTQATTGVGVIALACFLGILARLAQASGHHEEIKRFLEEKPKKP